MTRLTLLFVLALLIASLPRAQAAVFGCSGSRIDPPECADRELLGLDKAVDARFDAVVAKADPLTALLLRRDQAWFGEIVTRGFTRKYEGADDPVRLRLMDTLARRLETLNAINPRALAAGPAGTWGNALATVTVRAAGTDALQVTLAAKLAYEERNDTLTCEVGGMFKQDGSDWFVGELASQEVAGARSRLRLQGNTLRIVSCRRRRSSRLRRRCVDHRQLFPDGPRRCPARPPPSRRAQSHRRSGVPRHRMPTRRRSAPIPNSRHATPRSPAFTAETMRRLEPRLAARLRADQRAFVKDNPTAYAASLHPAAAKRSSMLHHTDDAREELRLRLDERFAMLANLDEKRKGIAGLWEAYNAALTVVPADDKTDGTATAQGFKWETGDYKSRCDFRSAGRIERGVFKAADAFPTLTRDGAMLVLSAADRDDKPASEAPDYCNRLPSAKARLFPVRPIAGVGAKFDRFR